VKYGESVVSRLGEVKTEAADRSGVPPGRAEGHAGQEGPD
jgi:hypothetical protein